MRALKITAAILLGFTVATAATAQRGRQGSANGQGPQVDPTQTIVVEGVVVQFVAGLGQGMPELQVEDAAGTEYSFVLGPFWYLTEQGFTAEAGDEVTVTAYVCAECDTGLAVASVVNSTKGVTLNLRDETGKPLWTSRQGGGGTGGQGGGCQGNGGNGNGGKGGGRGSGGQGDGGGAELRDHLILDLTKTTTFVATVTSYTVAAGNGAATLVAATDSGEISFLLSPIRVLLRAEFTPAAGDALEITAAPATVDSEQVWVVLTIRDVATGLELVLRDPATGFPVAGKAHRGRP